MDEEVKAEVMPEAEKEAPKTMARRPSAAARKAKEFEERLRAR